MREPIAIITGISGQDGAYLAALLLRQGYKVVGLTSQATLSHCWRLKSLGIWTKVKLVEGDVVDTRLLRRVTSRYKPKEWYNLAAISSVAKSWEDPTETFRVNALAPVKMLEALRQYSPKTRFFQASSAEIYGDYAVVIDEKTNVFAPKHPYGLTKLASHFTVKNWREQYGLFAVNGILFSHESPLRAETFVTKKIVEGAVKISLGRADKLTLGDINKVRDFAYAPDVVEAMRRMLQADKPEDFVICTGKSVPISSFVAEAFRCVGLPNWRRYVQIAQSLIRKQDVEKMRGTPARIKRVLGWQPKTSFKQLIRMMVDYEWVKLQRHH